MIIQNWLQVGELMQQIYAGREDCTDVAREQTCDHQNCPCGVPYENEDNDDA
jgi:hypothetical protein